MWNDGLIIEIMDLSHIHLLAVTICSSRYLELPTVLHEAMQASQLENWERFRGKAMKSCGK